MGAAIAGCSLRTSITQMYKRKDNIDVSGFKQYCSKCLKMVMDSLLDFDFMSMLYEGCSIFSIWNATNLFSGKDCPLKIFSH